MHARTKAESLARDPAEDARSREGFEQWYDGLLPADRSVRILDIGCGWGEFLCYLRDLGYTHLSGMDIGAGQVEVARSKGIDAEVADDLPLALAERRGMYDLITLNQVIEHFQKERVLENVRAIAGALKPGGRFIVTTPNAAAFSGLVSRYTDFTHELLFTERSLAKVLQAAGFDRVEVRGERIRTKGRPKRMLWLLALWCWHRVLGLIYLIERGMDRPLIYSRHLVGIGTKC